MSAEASERLDRKLPYDYRTVDLQGAVGYADFGGEGPPLVMVHGLGGNHANWYGVGPLFTHRAHVYAIDLAGHGRTDPLGRGTDVHANQRLVDRFIREVVGAPAIIMGNSMGGAICVLEAARNPDAVSGMVLVNAAMPLARGARRDPEIALRFARYATPLVGERFLRTTRARGARQSVEDMIRICVVDRDRVPQEVVEAMVVLAEERDRQDWAVKAFLGAARSVMGLMRRPQRFLDLVRALRLPVLMVQGDRDRLVLLASAQQTARIRPDWTFEVFGDVGHIPMIEVPEMFAETVDRWFDGAGAPALRRLRPA